VGEPSLVFSTHIDCVPPFFPSRLEDGVLHGRGACDAKGILAAQVAAAERLRAAGETRIGLVFVAGEERGSDGAVAANRIASRSRYLINGEPTDNRLGAATRGVFRVKLVTRGQAAHWLSRARPFGHRSAGGRSVPARRRGRTIRCYQ
jgi:acetylornithine deacetylase